MRAYLKDTGLVRGSAVPPSLVEPCFLAHAAAGVAVFVINFMFDRCPHAEGRVASAPVVEDPNVLEDPVGELDTGLPAAECR